MYTSETKIIITPTDLKSFNDKFFKKLRACNLLNHDNTLKLESVDFNDPEQAKLIYELLDIDFSYFISKQEQYCNDIAKIYPDFLIEYYHPENFPFIYRNLFPHLKNKAALREELFRQKMLHTQSQAIIDAAYPLAQSSSKLKQSTYPEHQAIDSFMYEVSTSADPKDQLLLATLKCRIALYQLLHLQNNLKSYFKPNIRLVGDNLMSFVQQAVTYLEHLQLLGHVYDEMRRYRKAYSEYYTPKLVIESDIEYLNQWLQAPSKQRSNFIKRHTYAKKDALAYANFANDLKQLQDNFDDWFNTVDKTPSFLFRIIKEFKRNKCYVIGGQAGITSQTDEEAWQALQTGFVELGIDINDKEFQYFILAASLQQISDLPWTNISFAGPRFFSELLICRQLLKVGMPYATTETQRISVEPSPLPNSVWLVVRLQNRFFHESEDHSSSNLIPPESESITRILLSKEPITNEQHELSESSNKAYRFKAKVVENNHYFYSENAKQEYLANARSLTIKKRIAGARLLSHDYTAFGVQPQPAPQLLPARIKNYIAQNKVKLISSFLIGAFVVGAFITVCFLTGGAGMGTLPFLKPVIDLLLMIGADSVANMIGMVSVCSFVSGLVSTLVTIGIDQAINVVKQSYTKPKRQNTQPTPLAYQAETIATPTNLAPSNTNIAAALQQAQASHGLAPSVANQEQPSPPASSLPSLPQLLIIRTQSCASVHNQHLAAEEATHTTPTIRRLNFSVQ